jgi:hypothetical protein
MLPLTIAENKTVETDRPLAATKAELRGSVRPAVASLACQAGPSTRARVGSGPGRRNQARPLYGKSSKDLARPLMAEPRRR